MLQISGCRLIRLIMNLFFQIQSMQLLILCIVDQEFEANLGYALLCLRL